MDAAETLRELLQSAHHALREGEAAEAERRAKAVTAIVRAERDVADYLADLAQQAPEVDEDALRAEFIGRLRRLAEAERSGMPDHVLEQIASGAPA